MCGALSCAVCLQPSALGAYEKMQTLGHSVKVDFWFPEVAFDGICMAFLLTNLQEFCYCTVLAGGER